jgi:hypothetical protein
MPAALWLAARLTADDQRRPDAGRQYAEVEEGRRGRGALRGGLAGQRAHGDRLGHRDRLRRRAPAPARATGKPAPATGVRHRAAGSGVGRPARAPGVRRPAGFVGGYPSSAEGRMYVDVEMVVTSR